MSLQCGTQNAVFLTRLVFLQESSIKIAVIGAGISGLAAASSLAREGFDVVLLEASDYIGLYVHNFTFVLLFYNVT